MSIFIQNRFGVIKRQIGEQSASGSAAIKPLDTTTHYTILGVSKTATMDEIKEANTLVQLSYIGTDSDIINRDMPIIKKAYETLSDPEQRAIYDSMEDYKQFHNKFQENFISRSDAERAFLQSKMIPDPESLDSRKDELIAVELSISALDKVRNKGASPVTKWAKVSDKVENAFVNHESSDVVKNKDALIDFLHQELEKAGHASTKPDNYGNYTIRKEDLIKIAAKLHHAVYYADKCSKEELPRLLAENIVIDKYHEFMKAGYGVNPKDGYKSEEIEKLEKAENDFAKNIKAPENVAAYANAIKDLFINRGHISDRPEKIFTFGGEEITRSRIGHNAKLKDMENLYTELKSAFTDLEKINHPHLSSSINQSGGYGR